MPPHRPTTALRREPMAANRQPAWTWELRNEFPGKARIRLPAAWPSIWPHAGVAALHEMRADEAGLIRPHPPAVPVVMVRRNLPPQQVREGLTTKCHRAG